MEQLVQPGAGGFALNGGLHRRVHHPAAPPTIAPPTTTAAHHDAAHHRAAHDGAAHDGAATTTSPASEALDQTSTVGRVRRSGPTPCSSPGPASTSRAGSAAPGSASSSTTRNNDYVVQVDGTTVATLVTPGRTTYWVDNLTNADHTVRLAKRTESPWAAGEFGGLVAAPGGAILAKPAARSRQIEFIGDSWTAGYGNMSTTRDCNSNGGVTRNSNADVSPSAR